MGIGQNALTPSTTMEEKAAENSYAAHLPLTYEGQGQISACTKTFASQALGTTITSDTRDETLPALEVADAGDGLSVALRGLPKTDKACLDEVFVCESGTCGKIKGQTRSSPSLSPTDGIEGPNEGPTKAHESQGQEGFAPALASTPSENSPTKVKTQRINVDYGLHGTIAPSL